MGSREHPELQTENMIGWSEDDPSKIKELIDGDYGISVDTDNGDRVYEIRFYKHLEFPVTYCVISVRNKDSLRLYLFEKEEKGLSCLQEREEPLPVTEYVNHISELEKGFLSRKGFDVDKVEILPGALWEFCLFKGNLKG